MIPTLRTPRLVRRAFHERDLDACAARCADEEVVRHIGTGSPVGRLGFIDPEGWPGFELGRLPAREAWGHGVACEGAAAALAFAHDEWGRRDAVSLIRPANERAARLARRLGAAPQCEIDLLGATAQVWRHA